MRFIAIPSTVLRKKISANAKLLYGLLRFYQFGNDNCWPARGTLAKALGCSDKSISRAIMQLENAGLVEVERRRRSSSIYTVRLIRDNEYLRLTSDLIALQSKTAMEKLLYAYLLYREGKNGVCWPHQRTIAADLGVTLPTIQTHLQAFEENHLLQVRHAHGGLKQGNRYRTTKLLLGTLLSPKSQSRTKKCPPKHNTSKELKETIIAQRFFGRALSAANAQDQAYRLLIRHGVHQTVATNLVYNQEIPPGSITNAVKNALARRAWLKRTDPFRAEQFKIPGYIISSLNKSHREGHTVKLSNRSECIERLRQPYKTLPVDEFEQRRRRQIRELRVG